MISCREGGRSAWTRMPVGQLAYLLQPQAGRVTQRRAGQDTGEGAEIDEARPARDRSHGPEYAPRGANFLWVARGAATYQLAKTRYP
ncbi:hypothetical protein BH11GEM1_BH11GEM1_13940 [soil metagenome]